MGLLDEHGLDRLIDAGCTRCGARTLTFRTLVDGKLPLMDGEPVGKITWIYDGEKFVDGVYRVECTTCAHVIFSSEVCPRCHAPDGLARALETPNNWSVPRTCPGCDDVEVQYLALIPAVVTHDGKRPEKARSQIELHENGFHGFRVDCQDCGTVAVRLNGCPACDAPGPLRVRPG